MIKFVFIILLYSLTHSQETSRDSLLFSDTPLKNPNKALMFSALIPGSGQIYNESYIKSGIIVISFTYFLTQAITFNSKINDLKASSLKYKDESLYLSRIDEYYDDRNVAVWRLFGVYLYNLLDSYIGAYLFGFDEIMDKNKATSYIDYNKHSVRFNLNLNF